MSNAALCSGIDFQFQWGTFDYDYVDETGGGFGLRASFSERENIHP